jgi:hypothetical protein
MVPPVSPLLFVLWRPGGGEQSDEQFEAGDAEIRARPIKVEDGVAAQVPGQFVWLDQSGSTRTSNP